MAGLLLTIIYICFISLGLPDSLLGSAWPMLHIEINVPVSYAGIISMIISGGTITSSLMCDHIQRKYGTGKITAVSIALTAIALFGFSMSTEFWMLVLWAIPYGLGAGGVDAVLNITNELSITTGSVGGDATINAGDTTVDTLTV